jgi:hypothetical protein
MKGQHFALIFLITIQFNGKTPPSDHIKEYLFNLVIIIY